MSSDCWWGSAGHVWLFLGHEPVWAKYILKHIIQGIIERTPGEGSSQQAQSMMSQRAYASLSLRDLHWLPVLQRVQFKSLCMIHRAAHGKGPIPLQNRFTWYRPSRNLCSAAAHLVCTSKIRRVRIGGRAFSHTALCLWNKLPLDLRFRIYNSVEKDWKSGCSPGIRSTSCFLYSHLTSAVLVIAAPGYPSGDSALYKCFLHYITCVVCWKSTPLGKPNFDFPYTEWWWHVNLTGPHFPTSPMLPNTELCFHIRNSVFRCCC